MVKVPRAGRVKTRLGQDMGMTVSAWWFRHQVDGLLRKLRDPRWRLVLAVSPDREGLAFPRWPRGLARLPQGRGDLGARMERIFRRLPPGPGVIIGGDIPGIDREAIADAFRALKQADAVIGPATDGGYWLIGMRQPNRFPRQALSGVRWSGPHARGDTLAALAALRTRNIRMLSDVDSASDLPRRNPA